MNSQSNPLLAKKSHNSLKILLASVLGCWLTLGGIAVVMMILPHSSSDIALGFIFLILASPFIFINWALTPLYTLLVTWNLVRKKPVEHVHIAGLVIVVALGFIPFFGAFSAAIKVLLFQFNLGDL